MKRFLMVFAIGFGLLSAESFAQWGPASFGSHAYTGGCTTHVRSFIGNGPNYEWLMTYDQDTNNTGYYFGSNVQGNGTGGEEADAIVYAAGASDYVLASSEGYCEPSSNQVSNGGKAITQVMNIGEATVTVAGMVHLDMHVVVNTSGLNAPEDTEGYWNCTASAGACDLVVYYDNATQEGDWKAYYNGVLQDEGDFDCTSTITIDYEAYVYLGVGETVTVSAAVSGDFGDDVYGEQDAGNGDVKVFAKARGV